MNATSNNPRPGDANAAAPVRAWLPHPMPKDVAAAVDRLARSNDVRHVAVMPDAHLAHEVCVGTVVATTRLIYPAAVGGDIGCGIATIAFDVSADLLSDPTRAARVLAGIGRLVPVIRHGPATRPTQPAELIDMQLSDARLDAVRRRDGVVQFGTLGRGNHFLELQADESDGRLWVAVHSGSRAVGPAAQDRHVERARAAPGGLRALDAELDDGRRYLSDMAFARAYARASRAAMLDATCRVLADVLGAAPDASTRLDVDHNHVRQESHFGELLYVHRKGAMPANDGAPGVVPGSMGAATFHVEGRGCEAALRSSAHGAGRAMSRDAARRSVSAHDLRRQIRGVWVDPRVEPALREEAPSAYKDVRAVLRAQRELTKTVRTLRPVLCYKGAG